MAFKRPKGQENIQPAPEGVRGKEVEATTEVPPVEQQGKLIKGISKTVWLNGKNQDVVIVSDFPDPQKTSVTAKLEFDECELWVVDGKKLVKLKEGKQFGDRRPASDNPNLAKRLEE